jgi:hypothetical protein
MQSLFAAKRFPPRPAAPLGHSPFPTPHFFCQPKFLVTTTISNTERFRSIFLITSAPNVHNVSDWPKPRGARFGQSHTPHAQK